MKRVASICLPRLPIERWTKSANPAPEARVALVTEAAHGQLIHAATDAAMAAGARPGARLTDARAIDPGLIAVPADPAGDSALLDRLARWASRWSPLVEVDGADGLRLDASGVAHLFGGEPGLVRDMEQRFDGLGLTARAAIGPTPGAAWALARFGNAPLSSLSRRRPAPAPDRHPHARAARPQDDRGPRRRAAAKPGAAVPRSRQSARCARPALGRKAEPISATPAEPPPRALLRLAEPVADPAAAPQALGLLVPDLVRELEARKLGARRLVLTGYRVDGEVRQAIARHRAGDPRNRPSPPPAGGEGARPRSRFRLRRIRAGGGMVRAAPCDAGRADRRAAAGAGDCAAHRPADGPVRRGQGAPSPAARQPYARTRVFLAPGAGRGAGCDGPAAPRSAAAADARPAGSDRGHLCHAGGPAAALRMAARGARHRPRRGARADFPRMVARAGKCAAARLLPDRGCRRPPLLDLSRGTSRRRARRRSRLVHARAVRLMPDYSSLRPRTWSGGSNPGLRRLDCRVAALLAMTKVEVRARCLRAPPSRARSWSARGRPGDSAKPVRRAWRFQPLLLPARRVGFDRAGARRARDMGMDSIGIADRNTLAGVVRMHSAAKGAGLRPLIGCRLDLVDCPPLLAYPLRSRRLWPAVAPAVARQDALRQGRVRSDAGRSRASWPGHRLHRHARRGSRRVRDRRFPAMAEALPTLRHIAARTSTPATTSRGSTGSTRWRRRTALRCSPPTTSTTMRPSGGRCRT